MKESRWDIETLQHLEFEKCHDVPMVNVPTCQSYQEMVFLAFRYSLRRHTYVVKDAVEYICNTIHTFYKKWLELFEKELGEYFDEYYADPEHSHEFDCDVREWNQLLITVKARLIELKDKK